MSRYRVHVVARNARFAPLLTVLVEASSREEALRIAELRCAGSKGVWAGDVSPRQPESQLRLFEAPAPESVSWSDCAAVAQV
jgi:hypothetical protein